MLKQLISIVSTCSFISIAGAEEVVAPSAMGSTMSSMLLFSAMFVMFYFLMIRPQNKRQKEHRNLLNNLAVGDEVVTTSGIVGKISRITDNYFIINISEAVTITVQKAAVTGALPKGTLKAL